MHGAVGIHCITPFVPVRANSLAAGLMNAKFLASINAGLLFCIPCNLLTSIVRKK